MQAPSEGPHSPAQIPMEAPAVMMQVSPTPQCPNCSRHMVLSHKFYVQPGGPRMWHFHCTRCKVGLTEAENGEEQR
jgi:hypothetical protein